MIFNLISRIIKIKIYSNKNPLSVKYHSSTCLIKIKASTRFIDSSSKLILKKSEAPVITL